MGDDEARNLEHGLLKSNIGMTLFGFGPVLGIVTSLPGLFRGWFGSIVSELLTFTCPPDLTITDHPFKQTKPGASAFFIDEFEDVQGEH